MLHGRRHPADPAGLAGVNSKVRLAAPYPPHRSLVTISTFTLRATLYR